MTSSLLSWSQTPVAANETQYTSNNNNKELEVEWWDSNGWATVDGVNSLEECSRQSPDREQQGQTHQNLGQKELHQWRKWIESDKVREVSSNQTRYITGFDANYRTEPKTKIMASGPITSWEIDGETVETVSDFILGGSKITADGECSHEIKRCLLLGRKVMTNLDSILKSRHYFANKGLSSQGYGFSSGHVWMWKLDYKESWVLKNWCFWTVVLEKTLKIPWTARRYNQSILKKINPGYFIGRTDAEAETPVLWPPHSKNWLIGKYPDVGRDWGQEEKGLVEDEMAGWHHRLNGHEFE